MNSTASVCGPTRSGCRQRQLSPYLNHDRHPNSPHRRPHSLRRLRLVHLRLRPRPHSHQNLGRPPNPPRAAAYSWIGQQLKTNGQQAFIVCPFIEESETLATVKSTKAEFEKLKEIFTSFKLGLLHGKLKAKDKEQIIAKFRAGEYDILVSTPVVEVGIDIPSATIMVIEGSRAFRPGPIASTPGQSRPQRRPVILFALFRHSLPRLKALETHHSGFELAEIDLQLRGSGNIYGTSQHGIPNFKIARYGDFTLIPAARAAAEKIVPLSG